MMTLRPQLLLAVRLSIRPAWLEQMEISEDGMDGRGSLATSFIDKIVSLLLIEYI